MAGKKKKSVANKLAKMSDEERARYMQHRAEMEEEAKRRKEQLIATFMKKKVRKEEAFSRLNLAKINQNWHQILRRTKCQEMKENVEHLRKWIQRVLNYKNQTISILVKELDEAEDDYLNNFASHSNHINDILEKQNEYVDKLNQRYQGDLNTLLRAAEREKENIFKNAEEQQMHLKTILHRQKMDETYVKKEEEQYMQKFYEDKYEFESKLQKMRVAREEVCSTIWKGIEKTVKEYIDKTDPWRMHIAELKRLDKETTEEIIQNKEKIVQEETLKEKIKGELEGIRLSQELEMMALSKELEGLQLKFNKLRMQLHRDLQVDEKKMKVLVDVSYKTKSYLEGLVRNGNNILNLLANCKSFETDREKVMRWYSTTSNALNDSKHVEDTEVAEGLESTPQTIRLQYFAEFGMSDTNETLEGNVPPTPSDTIITTIQNVTVQDKPPLECSPQLTLKKPAGFVDECLKNLEAFENFWTTYNKVEVDYLDILGEKKQIQIENKQLRGMIRAVLEATALSHSIANSRVPTRLPSRRISACSAPIRRMIF